ncbi:MAG: hypothetical protein SOY30_05665 [Eubacteriales bacterium]|nr:hypothetical protein [Eubacteriales bacterium]
MTLMHLSGTGRGLCCTALLIILCAGLCASMMAVLWRTPARYTVGCASPALACFILLYGMLDDMQRGVTTHGLWQTPLWLWLVAALLLAVWCAGMLALLLRWHRRHLSQTSVKEGLDQLPAGLCFYVRDGLTRLVNERMQNLCLSLTGSPLMNGEEFWHRLETGDVLPDAEVMSTGGAPLVRTPDRRVWRFERRSIHVDGEAAVQIIASDVTQEHEMNLRLQEENLRLADMNRRLRCYSGQIRRLTREKEALEAKVRIHDVFGQALLAARRLTAMPSGTAQRTEVLRLWRKSLALMEGADGTGSAQNSLDGLIAAAKAIGVHIAVEGDAIPPDAAWMPLICSAAHECLTNTVRHAGGTELRIRMTQRDGWVCAVLTNDGRPPEGEIREGGGLSALRTLVEDAGGRMHVQSAPEFALRVEIPVKRGGWT